MELAAFSAAFVERALNAWLATDPRTARELSELEGLVIGLEVQPLGLELFFLPHAGSVRVTADATHAVHTRIRGGLFDLVKLGAGGQQPGGGAKLVIEGDVAAGYAFQRILKAGDFDWEELLAQRLGDVVAHELARGIRTVGRWADRSVNSLHAMAGDYLREEARLVPSGFELREFIRQVDCLRDKIERLDIRIEDRCAEDRHEDKP